MARFIVAQLGRRWGRSMALLLGILIATTGFTVLTGVTATSRLTVNETVDGNFRAAYDVLVRLAGAKSSLEARDGVVRPNFLSGQFGGITLDQYERIKQIPGIEVAAPIAMIGYALTATTAEVDLTELLDTRAIRQVFRLSPTYHTDRGLTSIPDAPAFAYVTRRPVLWTMPPQGPYDNVLRLSDGSTMPFPESWCGDVLPSAFEVREDGRRVPLCMSAVPDETDQIKTDRVHVRVVQVLPDGRFRYGRAGDTLREDDRLRLTIPLTGVLLAAAIDPVAEAALVGLDAAVVEGRYLRPDDRPRHVAEQTPIGVESRPLVPALVASQTYVDESVSVGVARVVPAAAQAAPGTGTEALVEQLRAASADTLATVNASTNADGLKNVDLMPLIQAGPPSYDIAPDGALVPRQVEVDPQAWGEWVQGRGEILLLDVVGRTAVSTDVGFRPLVPVRQIVRRDPATSAEAWQVAAVGRFDAGRLRGFSKLSRVPLETYEPPAATGADARSRGLLGGRSLAPNSNPAGYLATPPLLLTTLDFLSKVFATAPEDLAAPLSAVRVRVAGVRGVDEASRERVRLVAEQIAVATGLDTDITVGSSPAPREVALPAGRFGRPELRLAEGWSKKGVAVAVVEAIDRKSAILFGMILVVCVLFLGNAVSAAVRDRRRELAVLACLGWSRRRLAGLIAGEVAALGLVAGAGAAALAAPVAAATGTLLTTSRALLAVPVGLGVALLAALVPAWRASRGHPAVALHPAVMPARRRAWRRRGVAGLAAANIWRVPGRTALCAAALTLGVAGLTLLTAVDWAFHGAVTGSLLGDAVSLQVRHVDLVAAAVAVLLGLGAVTDVLYLNVRERASELAALAVTGWSQAALGRLITYEGIGIGLIGALSGAGLGLAAAAWFVGEVSADLLAAAAVVAAAGTLATATVALVPALMQRRIPVSTMLAEE